MSFPNSASRIQIYLTSHILILITNFLFFSGCSVTKIFQEIPPSPLAISGINYIYVESFKGEQSILFNKILTHEINEQAFFEYLSMYPEVSKKFKIFSEAYNETAILNVEVTRYVVKDIEEIRPQKQIILVEEKIIKKNPSGPSTFARKFNFVEKPYSERAIHRTLDLEISFKISNITKDKTLYTKKENVSFKHSYFGEEKILLIPDSSDEMARLAQLLIQKFLDRTYPEQKERVIELEKGTNPVPWTLGLLDFGHPRIVRSNHFAIGERYDLALKGWNYVLFEPRTFPESEKYVFTDEVFIRLKKAGLPNKTLKSLFGLHGKSFDQTEINIVLLGMISNQNFGKYSKIIKSHSLSTENINRINLASAHYNLGTVYQIRNELELADYHFAQANAYDPNEKYSFAWTNLKHLKGNYNPLEDKMRHSIKSAGKLVPPDGALLNPKK